ncbi:hypothetical protein [Dinghuibacter silviterrae]|uniref:DUF1868 domain-containing protein n=1 Tax=Dinghuibacter silviterrae TaxID=1539049 RepID=A0A4R8DS46_9BACT|nr:hypothetical protein [Dinghuibacter silviterrae]TDX00839.1 hypothetical protein EDB95_1868 [Dinghuibacter silviterrae]
MSNDLSFDEYTARQYRELEPEHLLTRALTLQPSGHYRRNGRGWVSLPYPGFAVVSMVDREPLNQDLPGILESVQAALWEHCPWGESLYFLPASSFHQTIANTLSEDRFIEHIARPGLEGAYPQRVAEAFARIPRFAGAAVAAATAEDAPGPRAAKAEPEPGAPIRMPLAGLSIFGTALGVLGVFEEEESYQRILHFREHFYKDPAVRAFDVRRTRPFIGHVTLAYVETDLTTMQREELGAAVHSLNQAMFAARPVFHLAPAELRRYENLSAFERRPTFPQYIL